MTSEEELNRAAAECMGFTSRAGRWWGGIFNVPLYSIESWQSSFDCPHWSPATKIEHAWIVMQACDPHAFGRALLALCPEGRWEDTWLATAPPRARTEAAVQVLTNRPTGTATGE